MSPVVWLIIFVIMLGIEICTLGLATIWFAGGALIALLVSLITDNIIVQIVIFIVVSLVLLIFTRPIALKYFNKGRTKTNVESIIGVKGKVTGRIDNLNETGTVRVKGLDWTARSLDGSIIEENAVVVIREVSGVKLIVERFYEENQ